MPANIKIRQDFSKLEQLNKNLKQKHIAKVGILGNKSSRDEIDTNAGIGAKHEFGSLSEGIPRRSFLKDPLSIKSKDINSTISKLIIEDITKKNGITSIFKKIGIKAEQIISLGFASGGFGTWKPLSKTTIESKGSSAILIDTAQLRKSISSTVEKI